MSELNKLLEKPSDVETDRAAEKLRWEVIICTFCFGAIIALSSC